MPHPLQILVPCHRLHHPRLPPTADSAIKQEIATSGYYREKEINKWKGPATYTEDIIDSQNLSAPPTTKQHKGREVVADLISNYVVVLSATIDGHLRLG